MPMAGIYAVAPTPFQDDGTVDLQSINRLTELLVESGVHGMLVLGVMGEAHKLLDDERDEVLRQFVDANRGRTQIVAGVSHGSTHATRELADRAIRIGADAVMASPPSLQKPNLEAVRRYFEGLADGFESEIVVQDHPASSGVYMPVDFLATLIRDVDPIRSAKLEDPPTAPKIASLLAAVDEPVNVFGGLGGISFIEELDCGADGAMTGFAYPEVLIQIWEEHRAGNISRAREIFHYHLPLIRFEAQPIISLAIRKRVYEMRGALSSAHLRSPAPLLNAETTNELNVLLRELELDVQGAA